MSVLSHEGYIEPRHRSKGQPVYIESEITFNVEPGNIRNIYEHSEWKLIYKNIFSSNNLPDKIATCSSLTRIPMHLCNIYNRIDTPDQFRIKSRDLDLYSKIQSWNNVMIEKCQI